ncbi:MAG: GGDEF domain-containing protein [Chloroflexi bacterium]|nr:GGDEF domain-containing protein [Chloroflexota bacterium]
MVVLVDHADVALRKRMRMLAETPMFEGFPAEHVQMLAERTELATFGTGEAIVRQGDPGDSLYIIASGQVQVLGEFERDGITTEVVLAWLLPGDVLGELSLLDGQPRSATCMARNPTTCLRLGREAFLDALEQQWPLTRALLTVFAHRLRAVDERLADHARDPLTELANRRALVERYHREVQRAHLALGEGRGPMRSLAVLFADVDRFKSINDTYGHHVGDQVLCAVGRLLTQSIRASDLAARYAGDEFVALLPDAGPEGVERVVARLRRLIEHEHPGPVPFTLSIGVAIVDPHQPTSLEDLLQAADRAMYQDKARLQPAAAA